MAVSFTGFQSCWLGSTLTALLTSGGLNNDTSCSIQCILQSFNPKTLYDRLLRVAKKFPRHAKNGASRWWMSGHPQWHLLAARWISREIPHRYPKLPVMSWDSGCSDPRNGFLIVILHVKDFWICFFQLTWAATWALWFKIRIQKSIIEKVPAYSTDSVAELSVPELRNLWLRMHMEEDTWNIWEDVILVPWSMIYNVSWCFMMIYVI